MSEWAGLQLSTAQKDIPSYHLGSSATEEPAGSAGSQAWIEITMTMTTIIITTLSRIIPNTYCIFTRCRAGTALSSLCILTYLMCIGNRYYYYTHFTEDKMEAEEVEELAQDRKTSRGCRWDVRAHASYFLRPSIH